MLTTTRDRIAAATGAAFVALIVVGNAISTSGTSQAAHPSGAQVLKDIAHQASSTSATVGFILEFLGFVAFLGFLGYLGDALRRRIGHGGANVAGATAVVAGSVMLAVKLASVAPSGALFADRRHISPQLAQVLNDINGVAFVVSWLPFTVFVGAAALALRKASLVGRPTAYVGICIAVVGLVLTMVSLQDPFNGTPVAFMLGLLWTLVVSVRLAVKPGSDAASVVDYVEAPAASVAVGA